MQKYYTLNPHEAEKFGRDKISKPGGFQGRLACALEQNILHGIDRQRVMNAFIDTSYGRVSSYWENVDGKIKMQIKIPANTTPFISFSFIIILSQKLIPIQNQDLHHQQGV